VVCGGPGWLPPVSPPSDCTTPPLTPPHHRGPTATSTCRVDNKRVVTNRPLAGTRRRGTTPEADKALEAELLADEKEVGGGWRVWFEVSRGCLIGCDARQP
jgi:hypothetical protein